MNKKLYCCYSVPLRDFLKQHNIKYELCALNPNTKTTMWIYVKDDKLNELLTEWSKGSKKSINR